MSHILRCSVFQVVALGYCQTTVNEVVSAERKLPCFGLRSLLLLVSRRRLRNLRLILDYLRLLGRSGKSFLSPAANTARTATSASYASLPVVNGGRIEATQLRLPAFEPQTTHPPHATEDSIVGNEYLVLGHGNGGHAQVREADAHPPRPAAGPPPPRRPWPPAPKRASRLSLCPRGLRGWPTAAPFWRPRALL
jgi:hypothetical protein